MDELLKVTFITGLLVGTVRIATPILLAALGELITERSGVMNLGVEGTMLMGAFIGFIITYRYDSLWLGFIAGVFGGGILSLLMAFLVSSLKVDQAVAGLSINLLSSGLTFFFYRLAFIDYGSQNIPNLAIFTVLRIPYLSNIPVIGEAFFSQYAITYIAVIIVPIVYFFLYHTTYGLELRCLGENPKALDMKGINVTQYQYYAIFFGGMMAGAGGAFLTLASAGIFIPNIVSGRGWIAVAIVIFGDWKPLSIMLGALFFGLVDSFQLQAQGLGFNLPYQFLLALPYLLTIAALIFNRRRSNAPDSLGIPYFRA